MKKTNKTTISLGKEINKMDDRAKLVMFEFALEILTDEYYHRGLINELEPYRIEDGYVYLNKHNRIEYTPASEEYPQESVYWCSDKYDGKWELMIGKDIR
jgi:hypothetical protein